MIEISNVKKVFKNKKTEVHALKDVSLKVEKGDIFGIVGYSGAGKSTLLRLVNLLEKPDSGSVKIKGKEIVYLSERELNKLRKNIGMVFQQFNLLEAQTVYQNLKIPNGLKLLWRLITQKNLKNIWKQIIKVCGMYLMRINKKGNSILHFF
ncbi:ATP-binding cassette domain-containing protein [Pseudoleptotrichia goodfellowii]|jgi:methionine import ATP-binding protein metN 2|uniref:Methionine import ATP-binding protein MetN 2 family protein n=1 Tax=Pseudoleptotrichia goodfellowii F0264 TaxID=596323 RepID=D0GL99_9FUSO|nr:ATP-binding cassette domain-containing protein [Pseudoleptotrichia goodfellowii]EEY35138.1 methionine import ATP-binding protein MetN 2 family protein [Pseudoleptotrichia goodfellowii F0264]